MTQPNRLAADAAHEFGGTELDRTKPLQFRVNGRKISGFAGDTVLTALLANGVDSIGVLDGLTLGLTDRFAPLVASRRDKSHPLPMDRMPARNGDDLVTVGPRLSQNPFRPQSWSLRHRLTGLPDAPWHRSTPETTLTADLLIIGGGVAGLVAAEAAAGAGHSVIVVERRPWFGGDARFFGAIGDEESPEAIIARLLTKLAALSNVTLLGNAEVYAVSGTTARVHHLEASDGAPRAKIVAVSGERLLIASGARQRLPVLPGNRLPGVASTISAYHLAKRYGVSRGKSVVVATQSNFGYRLALRLNDAGVSIRRVVDSRLVPQSRFVDFAKASGLTIASGQYPLAIRTGAARSLLTSFANTDTTVSAFDLEADRVIVGGPWQPDISLWMLAGGGAAWNVERGRLESAGVIPNVALAGSAAGWQTMQACIASARAAVATLFGRTADAVEDVELDAMFETPDAATPISPVADPSAFLDDGSSLAQRDPSASYRRATLSLGDVASGVEMRQITPVDAGTIAEERGAAGADLIATDWTPPAKPAPAEPAYLKERFGPDPARVHLVVNGRRSFEIGALVHAAGGSRDPLDAIGVIVARADVGGIAMIAAKALKRSERFVVETVSGPSPARISRPPDAPPLP